MAGSGRVATASAAVAVSASGAGEDDSNISLLLCEETIPGSPAPDAEPAPPRQRLHMPFASAPPHHHTHSKGMNNEGKGDNQILKHIRVAFIITWHFFLRGLKFIGR